MSVKQYCLMNKNKEVFMISQDEESKEFISIDQIMNIDYAPFSIYQSFNKETILEAINFWYTSRSIPNYREGKESIIKQFDLKNIIELQDKDYALSLSDQYWLKPVDEKIMWEDINYFNHDYNSREFFNATYGAGGFQTMKFKEIDSDMYKTPNNTLGGELKKTWVKVDGRHLLLKGASSQHHFEQINEVLASRICEILEVPFISMN